MRGADVPEHVAAKPLKATLFNVALSPVWNESREAPDRLPSEPIYRDRRFPNGAHHQPGRGSYNPGPAWSHRRPALWGEDHRPPFDFDSSRNTDSTLRTRERSEWSFGIEGLASHLVFLRCRFPTRYCPLRAGPRRRAGMANLTTVVRGRIGRLSLSWC